MSAMVRLYACAPVFAVGPGLAPRVDDAVRRIGLASRTVIEHAKGVLIERLALTAEEFRTS